MARTLVLVLSVLCFALLLSPSVPEASPPNPCQAANIHPNPNALPNGQVGQSYCERFWVTPANQCAPGVWTVTPNPPVPGLTFTPGPGFDEAFLCGTPTTTGTYTFTINSGAIVVCGAICFQSQTYTVTIA